MFRILVLIFMICSSFPACGNKSSLSPSAAALNLIKSYSLQIEGASDLSFGQNYNSLWIVSDVPESNIFEVDLEGAIIREVNFKDEDLEGIVYDHQNDILWVVEEGKRELIKITLDGLELERHAIAISGPINHGFEGIAIDSTDYFWIANENLPTMLLLLNPDFSIKEQINLNIALDLSGLCRDTDSDALWIVSDESKLLIHWEKTMGVIEEFSLPFKKAEGIAIHPGTKQIYIVSDQEKRLYLFNINKE